MANYTTKKISLLDSIDEIKFLDNLYNIIVSKENFPTKITTIGKFVEKISSEVKLLELRQDVLSTIVSCNTMNSTLTSHALSIDEISGELILKSDKTDVTALGNTCKSFLTIFNNLSTYSSDNISSLRLIRTDYSGANGYPVKTDTSGAAYVNVPTGSGAADTKIKAISNDVYLLCCSLYSDILDDHPPIYSQLNTLSTITTTTLSTQITSNSNLLTVTDDKLTRFRNRTYGTYAFREIESTIYDNDMWTAFTNNLTSTSTYYFKYKNDGTDNKWYLYKDEEEPSISYDDLTTIGLDVSINESFDFIPDKDIISVWYNDTNKTWFPSPKTYNPIEGDLGTVYTQVSVINDHYISSINGCNIVANNDLSLNTSNISTENKPEYGYFADKSLVESLLMLSSLIEDLSGKITT